MALLRTVRRRELAMPTSEVHKNSTHQLKIVTRGFAAEKRLASEDQHGWKSCGRGFVPAI